MLTNRARIVRAARALRTYQAPPTREDRECAVVDLLADLRHYCEKYGFDFGDLNEAAAAHYTEEKEG